MYVCCLAHNFIMGVERTWGMGRDTVCPLDVRGLGNKFYVHSMTLRRKTKNPEFICHSTI